MTMYKVDSMDLSDVIQNHVLNVLEVCEWNYKLTCRTLGIGRTTLYRMLRRWKIKRKRLPPVPATVGRPEAARLSKRLRSRLP